MERKLTSPAVPPSLYDYEYFTRVCAGSEEWRSSGGARLGGRYPGFPHLAGLAPGEVVVDLGTGRGDLLVTAVAMGAARAVGVDYAPAAVELARQTIGVHGVADWAEAHLADARGAPVDTASADLVTLLDVVEHLAPAELADVLSEAHRVLRPGGRLFVHTFPTRTVYDVTYRLQRWARPGRRGTWLADPRYEHERLLHVNEQTRRSLRGVLRQAGFEPVRVWRGQWVHTDFVPEERPRRLYHRLGSSPADCPFGHRQSVRAGLEVGLTTVCGP